MKWIVVAAAAAVAVSDDLFWP